MATTIPVSLSQRQSLSIGVAFGITDIGTVRHSNQDNFLIDSHLDMVMVADGMGGHAAGEQASAGALQLVYQYLCQTQQAPDITTPIRTPPDPDATCTNGSMMAVSLLFDAIEFANQTLYQQNLQSHRPQGGMGTTLTGFCRPITGEDLVLCHVGDSRLYCQRNGQLHQLTHDQTLYQQALDAGQQENMPPRNLLLQAIGPGLQIQPIVRALHLQPADVLMLCSDGLHSVVSQQQIQQVMAQTQETTLEQACHYLVELAKHNGSRDNITVLMVKCLMEQG